ncbi:MAG: response regulator [Geobacter sp.]|nr:MAG: response regulator [Geobacter sp.]
MSRVPEGKNAVTHSGKNESILVVEDDKWARSFLRELLEGNGYKVIEAEDALSAVEKFGHHGSSIALVLRDMIIPKMSGRELCRELACIHTNVKILFMSGYPDDAIRARGIVANDVTILSKPFKPEELLSAVGQFLIVQGTLKSFQ